MDKHLAAHRFGFGLPKIGLTHGAKSLGSMDALDWLRQQITPMAVPVRIAELPSTASDMTAFTRWARSRRSSAGETGNNANGMVGPDVRSPARQRGNGQALASAAAPNLRGRYQRALRARFMTAVETDTPFHERLVHFWSNHFTVSAAKPAAMAMPPSFERDAVRPYVVGKFGDMLVASAKHPAMLFYLDNFLSLGPNSALGKGQGVIPDLGPVLGRPDGLNENYAREVLELHTLGVSGGYDQTDVVALANILTGWGFPKGRRGGFDGSEQSLFNENAHEPGAKTMFGQTFDQIGEAQGEAALRYLALRPETANHLATKLARHFIGDDPPNSLIEALARVYLSSSGDLGEMARILVEIPGSCRNGAVEIPAPRTLSCIRSSLAGWARPRGRPYRDDLEIDGRRTLEAKRSRWVF